MLWDGLLDVCYDVVGETLLGDLGASPDYLHHSKGFTETVAAWSGGMHILPSWLRRLYFQLSPGGRKIRRHLNECKSLIFPELDRLQDCERDEKQSMKSSVARGFLKHASEKGVTMNYDEIVHQMLIITFAAAPMWNMILNQVVQNHVAFPEHNAEMKKEVQQALEIYGGWTEAAFLNMPRLESFIRETLRCTPPIMCKSETLTELGLYLLKNTQIRYSEKSCKLRSSLTVHCSSREKSL